MDDIELINSFMRVDLLMRTPEPLAGLHVWSLLESVLCDV